MARDSLNLNLMALGLGLLRTDLFALDSSGLPWSPTHQVDAPDRQTTPMKEKRHTPIKERYRTTKERFLERRKQGIEPEPPVSWWRQRYLFFTAISLALVLVTAFTVRGLYRFFPPRNQSEQHQEEEEIQIENIDYQTAKQLFSGEISAATTE